MLVSRLRIAITSTVSLGLVSTLSLIGFTGAQAAENNFVEYNRTVDTAKPDPIIGGTPASITEAPWQVALLHNAPNYPTWDRQYCGGSIISPSWVVTAAHCVVPEIFDGEGTVASQMLVLSGTDKLSKTNPSPGVQTAVKAVIMHPNYNADEYNNDIALIQLATPLTFSDNQRAIALPEFSGWPASGTNALITGWGNISTAGQNYPTQMQKATVQVIGNPNAPNCGNYPTGQYKPAAMLCAGVPVTGGIDTCQGDSGGPLAVVNEGTPYLAGITSWGSACAAPGYPGIYTRVTSFIPWIKAKMEASLGSIVISGNTNLGPEAYLCASIFTAAQNATDPVASTCAKPGQRTVQITGLPAGNYKVYLKAENSDFAVPAWWAASGQKATREEAGLVKVQASKTSRISQQLQLGGVISVNLGTISTEPDSLLCFYAYRVGATSASWSSCHNPIPESTRLLRLPSGSYQIKVVNEGIGTSYPTQWYQGRTERAKSTPVSVSSQKTTNIAMNVTELQATPWQVGNLKIAGFTPSKTTVSVRFAWAKPEDGGSSPVTGYEIVLKQGTKVISTISTNALDSRFTGLRRGTNYKIEIRAENSYGYGAVSSVSFKTPK